MRDLLENLICEMLDGRILLPEAIAEFEKIYIQKALERHSSHLTKTAGALGIHRNTLSKRVAEYSRERRAARTLAKR
ncbi:MAG: helix-turn-helix domain-containing protein [Pyrinomonadaceae bacterium]